MSGACVRSSKKANAGRAAGPAVRIDEHPAVRFAVPGEPQRCCGINGINAARRSQGSCIIQARA